jgi:hypothetical protein
MKAKILITTTCLSIVFLISNAQQFNESVHFEPGSYELSTENQQQLNHWLVDIAPKTIKQISITGHTDADGSEEYNQKLSVQRAMAVYDYLLTQNVTSEQMRIASAGEYKPLASNEEVGGKQVNRRVELNAELAPTKYQSLSSELDVETQVFRGYAEQPIRIEGQGGTIVEIPAHSLIDKYGNPAKGKVKVTLKEYLTKSDFLMGGLHTQSGDELLESGGTILVEAYDGARKLELKPESQMDLWFASRTDGDSMMVFNGLEEHGQLDWQVAAPMSLSMSDSRNRNRYRWQLYGGFPLLNFIERIDNRLFNLIPDPEWQLDSAAKQAVQNMQQSQALVMNSSKLGWINCDRFNNEPKTVISAIVDTTYHANVFLVFDDINSVMNSDSWYESSEAYTFSNVPKGRNAKFLALAYIDQVPYYAVQDVSIGDLAQVELSMQQTSMNELKSIMKGLD